MTNSTIAVITGAGLGAWTMYLLDPQNGRRRRATTRDKLVHGAAVTERGLERAARDLSHRAQGAAARLAHVPAGHDDVPDSVLVERVRSRLGRVVSHPGAVTVVVQNGHVALRGDVLAGEVDRLLDAVDSVPGVRSLENQLDVHASAEGVPALQGGRRRRTASALMRGAPGPRLVVGAFGASLAAAGFAQGGSRGLATGIVGLGLIARSATTMPARRVLGVGAGRRAVDLTKTIHVDAPVEAVYRFWQDYENFPRFMTNVRDVRPAGEGRSRWVVAGPGGVEFRWTAMITDEVPNRVLAWKSLPGASVQHAGIVRFDPDGDGTRIHVRMSYNPPAGAVGHALASVLGADPKKQMDEDLLRMKTLLETGRPPRNAARPEPVGVHS